MAQESDAASQYGRMTHVVWFADLCDHIDAVRVAGDGALYKTGRVPSCLITVLRDTVAPDGSLMPVAYRPGATSWRWDPFFWRQPGVAKKALATIADGVSDPVIWLMGEYSSSDFEALHSSGLLPDGLEMPIAARRGGAAVRLVLRLKAPSEAVLPRDQGLGLCPGVRAMLFAAEEEPLDLYQEWVEAAQGKRASPIDALLTSDERVLEGCAGWLAPFGLEDREFAILAKSDTSPADLAVKFANTMELPLLVSHCTISEFGDWEVNHVLPRDLAEQL